MWSLQWLRELGPDWCQDVRSGGAQTTLWIAPDPEVSCFCHMVPSCFTLFKSTLFRGIGWNLPLADGTFPPLRFNFSGVLVNLTLSSYRFISLLTGGLDSANGQLVSSDCPPLGLYTLKCLSSYFQIAAVRGLSSNPHLPKCCGDFRRCMALSIMLGTEGSLGNVPCKLAAVLALCSSVVWCLLLFLVPCLSPKMKHCL